MSEERRVSQQQSLSFSLFPSLFFTLCILSSLFFPLNRGNCAESGRRAIVQRVSHVSAADYTRVIITLSDEIPHNLFVARADPKNSRPTRLVIDFAPARKGPDASAVLTIQDGILKQVRTGQFSPTTTRVVIDIERIDDYKIFSLYSPYRLIIDARGEARERGKPPLLTARPILAKPQQEQPVIIMLDPGHGGKDPGAIGERGVAEKDVVLAISQRLGRKLSGRLPVQVIYTRTSDVFIPLEERIARANAAKADLFISIHANASENPDLQGVETYYLNNTNDRATIRLASLENGVRPGGGNPPYEGLSYLLSDLIQSGKEEESIALASQLQEALVTRAKEQYPAVRNLGVKKGPFYVLVGAHMPCVLVETAFLSHHVEGKYLSAPQYQEALAEGLFLGVTRFLRTEQKGKTL